MTDRRTQRLCALLPSLELSEVGAYPQCQTWGPAYDRDAPESVYRVSMYARLPDRLALDGMVLAPAARLTDFLSTAFTGPGTLVNERARVTLSSLALGPHRFYPATVVAGATSHAYELLLLDPIPWAELGLVRAMVGHRVPVNAEAPREVRDVESLTRLCASGDWAPIEFEFDGTGARLDLLRVPGPWRAFASPACFEALVSASLTGWRR